MRTLVTEMEPCADPCKPREGLGRKWISEAIKPGEEGARVCCQETFRAGATWHHSLGVRCQGKAKPAQTLDWKPTTNPTSATSSDIWRISHVGRDVENSRYHHLGFQVSINGGKICLGSVDGYDGRENALHGQIQVGVKMTVSQLSLTD